MADETPSRISVSRDTLRAELAEMELRLRIYFDSQAATKADKAELASLTLRVLDLETLQRARDRGELTIAQQRLIDDRIENATTARISQGWTGRERWAGMVSVFIAAVMFILSILIAVHGGGGF